MSTSECASGVTAFQNSFRDTRAEALETLLRPPHVQPGQAEPCCSPQDRGAWAGARWGSGEQDHVQVVSEGDGARDQQGGSVSGGDPLPWA